MRSLLLSAVVYLCSVSMALAASSTYLRCDKDCENSCVRIVEFPWTSNSAGAATIKFDKQYIVGRVVSIQSVPGTISETFDATVTDENGEDILHAVGSTVDLPVTVVTRSVVDSEGAHPTFASSTLTANITSAGDTSNGVLRVRILLFPDVARNLE